MASFSQDQFVINNQSRDAEPKDFNVSVVEAFITPAGVTKTTYKDLLLPDTKHDELFSMIQQCYTDYGKLNYRTDQTLSEKIRAESPGKLFIDVKMDIAPTKPEEYYIKEVHKLVLSRFFHSITPEKEKKKVYSRYMVHKPSEVGGSSILRIVFNGLVVEKAFYLPYLATYLLTGASITLSTVAHDTPLRLEYPFTSTWRPIDQKAYMLILDPFGNLVSKSPQETLCYRELLIQCPPLSTPVKIIHIGVDLRNKLATLKPPEDENRVERPLRNSSISELKPSIIEERAQIPDLDLANQDVFNPDVDVALIKAVLEQTDNENALEETFEYMDTRACIVGNKFCSKTWAHQEIRMIKLKQEDFTKVKQTNKITYEKKTGEINKRTGKDEIKTMCWWDAWYAHAKKYSGTWFQPCSFDNRENRVRSCNGGVQLNPFQPPKCWSWTPDPHIEASVQDWSFSNPQAFLDIIEEYKNRKFGFVLNHIYKYWNDGSITQTLDILHLFCQYVFEPDKPTGKAVVLVGPEGQGKSQVLIMIFALLGAHCLKANDSEQLTSKFNEHLQAIMLVLLEESKIGKTVGQTDKFKDMVTAQMQVFELKGGDIDQKQKYTNYFLIGNDDVIPIGIDARRWWTVNMLAPDWSQEEKMAYDELLAEAIGSEESQKDLYSFLYFLYRDPYHAQWLSQLPNNKWHNTSNVQQKLKTLRFARDGGKPPLAHLWELLTYKRLPPDPDRREEDVKAWLEANRPIRLPLSEWYRDYIEAIKPKLHGNDQEFVKHLDGYVTNVSYTHDRITLKGYADCCVKLGQRIGMTPEQYEAECTATRERLYAATGDTSHVLRSHRNVDEIAKIRHVTEDLQENHKDISQVQKQILAIEAMRLLSTVFTCDPCCIPAPIWKDLQGLVHLEDKLTPFPVGDHYVKSAISGVREDVKMFYETVRARSTMKKRVHAEISLADLERDQQVITKKMYRIESNQISIKKKGGHESPDEEESEEQHSEPESSKKGGDTLRETTYEDDN